MATLNGGTTATINGNVFYKFLTSGNITFATTTTAPVLIVGGGGGGGGGLFAYEGAGGGGGGGVGYGSITFIGGITYNIQVGSGGNGAPGSASDALSSSAIQGGFSRIVGGTINERAHGGGRGGITSYNDITAGGGGSGGGGDGASQTYGLSTKGSGTILTYLGNNGGVGAANGSGAGGGGATQAGAAGTSNVGGTTANGGYGYLWPYTNVVYGDGGGGGLGGNETINTDPTQYGGIGGSGNGGKGGGTAPATDAVAGTGSGGGGGYGGNKYIPGKGGNGGSGVVYIFYSPAAICFKDDSLILTSNGYRKIQHLKKGDMVQTLEHGFRPIFRIGKKEINHCPTDQRSKEHLYRCPKTNYPDLFEDLFLTGSHSILVDEYDDELQRQKAIEVNGGEYVSEGKYRLPVCVDQRARIHDVAGKYHVYHIALENESYCGNYGIFANGLLVESTSKRFLEEDNIME